MKTTSPAASQVLLRVVLCPAWPYELAARPTPATADRLRRLGWLCKPLPDGFVLIGAAPLPPGTHNLLAATNLLPLLFSLEPQDPSFFAGSALVPGTVSLYRLQPGPSGAGRVVAAAALALRPLVFTQQLAAAPVARTAQLQGLAGTPGLPLSQPVPAGAMSSTVDVSGWGSGAYRWRLAAEAISFYADDYLMATQPRAALEVGAAVLHAAPGSVYTLGSAAPPPTTKPPKARLAGAR